MQVTFATEGSDTKWALSYGYDIGDPPRGGDVGVASLRSIITKGCASWYPCDARPRISGMILLELPILGPVDLSSL